MGNNRSKYPNHAPGAVKRGYLFEKAIAQIFEKHGFRATLNPKSAKPRQTDLHAANDHCTLLIEVKSVKRKIDVSDIDDLRSRLDRVPADVVGAIFALSGYTDNAIKEIESSRTREIIVFENAEISAIWNGKVNLNELVDRKREMLRTGGKVWFYKPLPSRRHEKKLPMGCELFLNGSELNAYISSKSENSSVMFARELPDTGWGGNGGEGVILNLRLDLVTIDDLANILALLHEKFGLTDIGNFSIEQTEVCWFGIGARNFIEAASVWRQRYQQNPAKYWHHSEDLHYFDAFQDGWLLLSTRQRVGVKGKPQSWLHGSELSIQLPGIPLDMSPFLQLCKYTNNQNARFRYIPQRMTMLHRFKTPKNIKVIGEIIRPEYKGDSVVTGIIAYNPFFHTKLPKELVGDEYSALTQLNNIELLVCDLSDWYDVGDVVDQYVLLGFETSWVNNVLVIRPFGTWENIVKRAGRKNNTSEKLLLLSRETDEYDQVNALLKTTLASKIKHKKPRVL
jgi:hypothetical protein